MRRAAAAAVVALGLAGPAQAADGLPGVTFLAASPANYAHVHRPASAIRLLVIHTIEGSYGGAISWFRNPRAQACANFVVSRDGAVTQMVPAWAVAWHAGNGYVNAHSLGIEHEGFTNVRWTVTDAEYRGSAQLVAQLVRRYRIPLDRSHVIGHNQVPDPNHPWLRGGFAHHTDPGRYWDWTRYLGYVRAYVAGTPPPPLPFDVTLPDLAMGGVATGTMDVMPITSGEPPVRIDLLVDGQLRASLTDEPFDLAWDTSLETPGRHVVTAHAVAADGRTADASVVVVVSNPPQPATVAFTALLDGQTVSGLVRWDATVTGRVSRIDFLVDGALVDTEFSAPFGFDWDTTAEAPGPHTLSVRAIRPDGKVGASSRITVTVAPPEPPPPPPPPAPAPAPAPAPPPAP